MIRGSLKFLEVVAESPEGMTGGLWWIIHEDKEKTNKRIRDLFSKMKDSGKPAEIIGPTCGLSFFRRVCNSLQLPLPEPIPFGINPAERFLVTRYTQRYGRARQLPPLDVP